MRILRFPGDSLLLGDSRYRLKRVGRDEWLDDHGTPTDDPEKATDFHSPTDASFWLITHIEEPKLYHFEEFFTIAC